MLATLRPRHPQRRLPPPKSDYAARHHRSDSIRADQNQRRGTRSPVVPVPIRTQLRSSRQIS